MMTLREAHLRASVHQCTIHKRWSKRSTQEFAAVSLNWNRDHIKRKAVWRDDIEDAVLDCGRIRQ